jgi:hypothetical protein
MDYSRLRLLEAGPDGRPAGARVGGVWDHDIYFHPTGGNAHLAPGFGRFPTASSEDSYFEDGGTFAAAVNVPIPHAPWSRGHVQNMRLVVGFTNYGDNNLRYQDPGNYTVMDGLEFFCVPVPLLPLETVLTALRDVSNGEVYWEEYCAADGTWLPRLEEADRSLATLCIEEADLQTRWHWSHKVSPRGWELFWQLENDQQRRDFAHAMCILQLRRMIGAKERGWHLLKDDWDISTLFSEPWNQAGFRRIDQIDLNILDAQSYRDKRLLGALSLPWPTKMGLFWARTPRKVYTYVEDNRSYLEYRERRARMAQEVEE